MSHITIIQSSTCVYNGTCHFTVNKTLRFLPKPLRTLKSTLVNKNNTVENGTHFLSTNLPSFLLSWPIHKPCLSGVNVHWNTPWVRNITSHCNNDKHTTKMNQLSFCEVDEPDSETDSCPLERELNNDMRKKAFHLFQYRLDGVSCLALSKEFYCLLLSHEFSTHTITITDNWCLIFIHIFLQYPFAKQ